MTISPTPAPLTVHPAKSPFKGTASVPGDKSISHRAALLAALAEGRSRIEGLLEGEDVLATINAVRALGVPAQRGNDGVWEIDGGGLGALAEPESQIDCGNAGTAARLLAGVIAANPITATLTGDASLRRRPMERVFAPLRDMGAAIECREGGLLPATVRGARRVLPLDWTMPMASAQVKSAILLAGLHCEAETRVVEPRLSRDHTERMLRQMGARIGTLETDDGGAEHLLTGGVDLAPLDVKVPSDPSSAALVAAAVMAVEGSEVRMPGVCVNPTRTGFLQTIAEMGADATFSSAREEGGEPVADLTLRHGTLKGVTVPAERAPSMIDEYPALAVVAAFAEGETRMEGVGELRAKESDRIAAVAAGLEAAGVLVETGDDWMAMRGGGVDGGVDLSAAGDHRLAMAWVALGLGARQAIKVDDGRPIATSFPGYLDLMRGLGADIVEDGT